MRVLVNGFASRTGGPETFLYNLLSHLADIDTSAEYVLLFPESRYDLYRKLPENIILKPVKENIADSNLKRLIHEHITVPHLFFKEKFDIYFQADELLSPILGIMRIPSIIVFHTTAHMLIPESVGDSKAKLIYLNFIKRLSMKHASVPVTVSHHAKGELAGLYPNSRSRIQVIYHGIDFNKFKPDSASESLLAKQYGIKDYFLSVSNRHEFKNHYNLIKAYHLLCQRNTIKEKLVIVGGVKSLKEEERIKEYIKKNQLEQSIYLIDYIEQYQVASVYQHAKAYLFPSTFETFGFTPLEAMACGIPTACSRFSCIPEICGSATEYFDPYDIEDMTKAMEQLLFNSLRREFLIKMGLEHVTQFSWLNTAKQYYKLMCNFNMKGDNIV